MIKCISLYRAVATATAALCACLLAFAGNASAFSPALKTGGGTGENTPLNLNPSSTAHTGVSSSSGGASIVRTIVGLAIVIAVIWGLAWILRQVKSHREGSSDTGQPSAGLASVAALTLGSGRSVHLVRAGNDYVLLGATEHGVAPIHRYTEEQAREAGLLGEFADLVEPPRERSRLLGAASQLLTGAGRAVGQAGSPSEQEGLPGDSGFSRQRLLTGASPVVGHRPDPMRMPSPSSGLVERLREMTVRR
ncbi:MAG: flagellar biosynthetic protein FliO [Solirubrobacteraceae bacterium]|jgi:flagellar protein FliO/FliZ